MCFQKTKSLLILNEDTGYLDKSTIVLSAHLSVPSLVAAYHVQVNEYISGDAVSPYQNWQRC